jgi:hypothetical protein
MARNLNIPEVEAVIVASCPESRQILVTEICKRKNFQKAYGRSGDMVDSLKGRDWMGKWQAKVVMPSITKAQSLNTRRIKIICIEGGKFCDEEHACMPHLKKAIAKEWIDSGNTTELRLECLWMGYDSFFEYHGHENIASKDPPAVKAKSESAKTGKANPKDPQQPPNLNNKQTKLPLPPPDSDKNPSKKDLPKNTKAAAPEKTPDQSNEREFSCEECSRFICFHRPSTSTSSKYRSQIYCALL